MKKILISLAILASLTVSALPNASVKNENTQVTATKLDCTYYEIVTIDGHKFKIVYACEDGRIIEVIPWDD